MPWVIYALSPRIPQPVVGPSGRVYRFHPKGINNWGMENVEDQDLQTILDTERGCCGSRGKFFHLATLEEVQAWEQNTVYHRRRR
jgi:hypothetical protein